MLAYYDHESVPEYRLFDTVLFLPYGSIAPSLSCWTVFLNDLFASGGELAELNVATQQVSNAIHENTIENVVISIPYPTPDKTRFGALTRTGRKLDFSGAAACEAQSVLDRKAAVSWFYDQVKSHWNQDKFTNLNFSGAYWNEDAFDPALDDESLENTYTV